LSIEKRPIMVKKITISCIAGSENSIVWCYSYVAS
jgi:hypothetical protein